MKRSENVRKNASNHNTGRRVERARLAHVIHFTNTNYIGLTTRNGELLPSYVERNSVFRIKENLEGVMLWCFRQPLLKETNETRHMVLYMWHVDL